MPLAVESLTVLRGECPVVDRVSWTARPGEVLALLGPNGAGKSTLLRAILGLIPSTGKVSLEGRDLRTMDPRERARRVAYVPQRSQLAAGLTGMDVVAQGRFAHQGPLARLSAVDRLAIDAALERTDATAFATRPFTQLSAGEQQRVLLARALATGAGTILLDEPTAALDVGHAMAFIFLIRELAAAGQTIVSVLHDLDEVHRAADQAVLLHRGRLVAAGPPAQVLVPEVTRPVFGVTLVAGAAWGVV